MKKYSNLIYGIGASVVIIGALFKITHLSIGPLTGNLVLSVGLLTEAFIFFVSAFEKEQEESVGVDIGVDRERIERNVNEFNKNLESLNEVYSSILKAHKCNQ